MNMPLQSVNPKQSPPQSATGQSVVAWPKHCMASGFPAHACRPCELCAMQPCHALSCCQCRLHSLFQCSVLHPKVLFTAQPAQQPTCQTCCATPLSRHQAPCCALQSSQTMGDTASPPCAQHKKQGLHAQKNTFPGTTAASLQNFMQPGSSHQAMTHAKWSCNLVCCKHDGFRGSCNSPDTRETDLAHLQARQKTTTAAATKPTTSTGCATQHNLRSHVGRWPVGPCIVQLCNSRLPQERKQAKQHPHHHC